MRMAYWIKAAAMLGLLGFGTICVADDGEEKEGKEQKVVKLPKAVAKSLKAKYPGAKIRGISKEKNGEGETIYEVEMTVKTKVDVNFDEKGEVEVIERQVGVFELPEKVRKVAAKAFPKGKIVRAETVLEEEGELNYEVVIKLEGKQPFEVLMAGNGKILKNGAEAKKNEKEEEEDDDEPKMKKGEKSKGEAKAKKGEKEEDEDEEDDDDEPKMKKGEKSKGEAKAKKGEKEEDDDDDDNDD